MEGRETQMVKKERSVQVGIRGHTPQAITCHKTIS